MKAIVTVFKSELKNREFVMRELMPLIKEKNEVDNALSLCPKDGKLVEFLSILRFHKIAYGTHFDTKTEENVLVKK